MVCIIARGLYNLPINFDVSGTYRSRLIGQNLSDASRDLATSTFDLGALEVTALVADAGLRAPFMHQV